MTGTLAALLAAAILALTPTDTDSGRVRHAAVHAISGTRTLTACTEDGWCWQALIQGNHRGHYLIVYPINQP